MSHSTCGPPRAEYPPGMMRRTWWPQRIGNGGGSKPWNAKADACSRSAMRARARGCGSRGQGVWRWLAGWAGVFLMLRSKATKQTKERRRGQGKQAKEPQSLCLRRFDTLRTVAHNSHKCRLKQAQPYRRLRRWGPTGSPAMAARAAGERVTRATAERHGRLGLPCQAALRYRDAWLDGRRCRDVRVARAPIRKRVRPASLA